MQVVAGYDRSGLINESIATLQRDLLEEAIIVSLVIIIFLFHFRSALIAILALPIAVLVSFIPIYFLGVTSNIMSLGGIALAVGVLVDAAIVMVENGYRHLSERQESDATPVSESERREILINAAKQVGPALFFSLLIIVVSFLPVFLLEAQEGRMFRPLAWTKNACRGFFLNHCNNACTRPDGDADSRAAQTRECQPDLAYYAGHLFARAAILSEVSQADDCDQPDISGRHATCRIQAG